MSTWEEYTLVEEVRNFPADRVLGTFKLPRFGLLFKMKYKVPKIIVHADVPVFFALAYIVLPSTEQISWAGEYAIYVKGRNFVVFDGVSGADRLDGILL